MDLEVRPEHDIVPRLQEGLFRYVCLFGFFCLMWWPIPISNNQICPHLENFAKQRTPNKVICFQGQATGRGFYYRTNKPTIDIEGSNLRERCGSSNNDCRPTGQWFILWVAPSILWVPFEQRLRCCGISWRFARHLIPRKCSLCFQGILWATDAWNIRRMNALRKKELSCMLITSDNICWIPQKSLCRKVYPKKKALRKIATC